MMILFKVIVCLLTFSLGEVLATDETNRKEPGFLLILPIRLQYAKNNTACLSLYNLAVPVDATINLKIMERDYILAEQSFDKNHSCFELRLPHLNETTQMQANVGIEIRANNFTLKGNNSNEVLVRSHIKQVTFLQTDRQIYKPGDIFKIRILIVNKDGSASKEQTIPVVKIKNPNDITVAVWKNVKTEQGLAHLEYQLSDETVEGQWNIEANDEIKTVEIKKYVLPRFKVKLTCPEEVYVNASQVKFKVCASYPYGQPVNKGIVQLNISWEQPRFYLQNNTFKNIVNNKELLSGCTQFTISVKEFDLPKDGSWWYWYTLNAKAIVTEAGTNQSEEAKAEFTFTTAPLKMEINAEEDLFRTGLPYNAEVKFKDVYTPIHNTTLRICYELVDDTVYDRNSFHTFCSNFTIDDENGVPFTIPPLISNTGTVVIRATCCGSSLASKYLSRIFSSTKSYIYLQQDKNDLLECESLHHFTVYYTSNGTNPQDNLTFQYMVKTDDKLYLTGEVNVHPNNIQTFEKHYLKNVVGEPNNYTDYNTTVASFNISFKLDRSILSKYKLLVYSTFSNGDIVVGTKEVELEPCLTNKVDMEWSKSAYKPSEEASLNIRTSPNSLCSLSAVDESTKFRSSDNFNIRNLLEHLSEQREEYYYNNYYDNCPKNQEDNYVWVPEVYSDKDTLQILQEFGVSIISNFNISTKPCRKEVLPHTAYPVSLEYSMDTSVFYSNPKLGSVPYSARGVIEKSAKLIKESSGTTATIRSFFPETWLWDLIPINKHGEAKLVRSVPHSITNWVSNAICVSPTDGVGMSDTKSFITFQPFFIDVITPYSIKRGEILHLVTKVFNYMNFTLPVHVSILQQDGLEVLDDANGVSKCVDASDSVDFIYKIRSTDIGKINITVVGEIDSSYKCGIAQNFVPRDVVRKTLLVEAEGFPVEIVKSELLCSNESHTKNLIWTLQLPNDSNLVADSAKAKLIFNSDILGSTVENLERLLVIPTGCGEQVMSTLAPNVYVLRYLNATNRLTADIKNRATENIKIGYQKILKYVHEDGSFSAFGESDGEGSMFLTVFVVRTLTQSKPYIYVDDSIINKSIAWIFEHQLDNGCFPPLHHLFHSLGDDKESDLILTSYVLISLKEAGIDIPKNVSRNAISCISNYKGNSSYSLVLISYALQLNGVEDVGKKYLDSVLKYLNSPRDATSNDEYSYNSKDIEIYGYAILSLLVQNDSDSIAQASNMVQWLTRKMSPRGGFASTQDTVVALDALSKYSVIFWETPNISAHFTASGQEKDFRVSADDQIKVTTFNLKRADDTIHLRTSGRGCVLSQAVLTYNVYSLTQKPAFNITVNNEVNSEKQHCVDVKLRTCVAYNTSGEPSKMVVMEIEVPSGYRANEQSLTTFLNQFGVDNKIKRYELSKDNVVIYFVGLKNDESCVSFDIAEEQKVENRTASTVNIFDYYKPEDRATFIFELHGCD